MILTEIALEEMTEELSGKTWWKGGPSKQFFKVTNVRFMKKAYKSFLFIPYEKKGLDPFEFGSKYHSYFLPIMGLSDASDVMTDCCYFFIFHLKQLQI